MFDKHAREMFDEQVGSAKAWPSTCNHHADIDMAHAQGMVAYALIRGDIGHKEAARMNSAIKAVQLNRTAKQIREQRMAAA